jgi:hypothetical protein
VCRLIVPLIALLATGCSFHHGETLFDVTPAVSPHGVTAHITLINKQVAVGELLFTTDTALYVLIQTDAMTGSSKVMRIRFTNIANARIGKKKLRSPFLPGTEKLTIIRQRSRFSYSITPEQLRDLLADYGQSDVTELGRPAQDIEAFLNEVRKAVATLGTIDEAIAAGYRQLGPEFPGMGQHWVHPGLVVSGEIDPKRPPVLAFAHFEATPRLVAVAFTMPLAANEAPPEYPAGAHVWHDHTGIVDEEALLISHPASTHARKNAPRLAMFHAWIGANNRDGVLAQNNWDLPFMQLGTALPDRPSAAAAHALSLLTADVEYFERVYTSAGELTADEISRVRAALVHARDEVDRWQHNAHGRKSAAELASIWNGLWRQFELVLPPDRLARLAHLASSTH